MGMYGALSPQGHHDEGRGSSGRRLLRFFESSTTPCWQKREGFTLLEVMVAVAIIAMALVAALGSQSQSVSLASEAKFATTAVFLAQQKMAELDIIDPKDLSSDSGDFGDDFPGYGWRADVADVMAADDGKASDHVKRIDLTVFWTDEDRYRYHLAYHRFAPSSI
jgi:general secretion pathway protein I